jgi:3-hydroxyacyl-[acyl-carrier-protein] dehydratase
MRPATDREWANGNAAPQPGWALSPKDEAQLNDALKRCSPSTREAAREFRRTGRADYLPVIVNGLIEHFVEPDLRGKLSRSDDGLRLVEDLAIDSLTMLEIVYLAEDVLQVTIDNEELRPFRTVGDIKEFLVAKLQHVHPQVLASSPGNPGTAEPRRPAARPAGV